jgi:hypothetical protein
MTDPQNTDERLSKALRAAMRGWPDVGQGDRWVREHVLPALAEAGLVVLDLNSAELVEQDLRYKAQEVEGLRRSCTHTTDELRAVRGEQDDLHRRVRLAELKTAEIERAAGAVALEAALVQQQLRADLLTATQLQQHAGAIADENARHSAGWILRLHSDCDPPLPWSELTRELAEAGTSHLVFPPLLAALHEIIDNGGAGELHVSIVFEPGVGYEAALGGGEFAGHASAPTLELLLLALPLIDGDHIGSVRVDKHGQLSCVECKDDDPACEECHGTGVDMREEMTLRRPDGRVADRALLRELAEPEPLPAPETSAAETLEVQPF